MALKIEVFIFFHKDFGKTCAKAPSNGGFNPSTSKFILKEKNSIRDLAHLALGMSLILTRWRPKNSSQNFSKTAENEYLRLKYVFRGTEDFLTLRGFGLKRFYAIFMAKKSPFWGVLGLI